MYDLEHCCSQSLCSGLPHGRCPNVAISLISCAGCSRNVCCLGCLGSPLVIGSWLLWPFCGWYWLQPSWLWVWHANCCVDAVSRWFDGLSDTIISPSAWVSTSIKVNRYHCVSRRCCAGAAPWGGVVPSRDRNLPWSVFECLCVYLGWALVCSETHYWLCWFLVSLGRCQKLYVTGLDLPRCSYHSLFMSVSIRPVLRGRDQSV